MSKDTKKNLVGQPILKQVMKILPREQFDLFVNKYGSDSWHYFDEGRFFKNSKTNL